jgi:hypothetical protein
MFAALAERKMQVALETRYTGSLPQVLSLPLACQVWAAVPVGSSAVSDSALSYGMAVAPSGLSPALLE